MRPASASVEWPSLSAMQDVAVGYTSGSTGTPRPNVKTWRSLHASTAGNLRMLHNVVGERFAIVATVPPQHIYGIEMSVLLPLLGDVQVHAGRPFFPADIATALDDMPVPRVTGHHASAPARAGRIGRAPAAAGGDTLGHRTDVAGAGDTGRTMFRRPLARSFRLHRNLRIRHAARYRGQPFGRSTMACTCIRSPTHADRCAANWMRRRRSPTS